MPLPHKRRSGDDTERDAAGRLARNRYVPSSRFLAPDGDQLAQEQAGIEGEKAVAKYLLLDTSPIVSSKRRKGYNLVGPNGETINAITSRKAPLWLPVEAGKVLADYYVQCHWDGKRCRLIGWASRDEVLAAEQRRLVSNGPLNHAIYVTSLRTMEELKRLMVPHTLPLL